MQRLHLISLIILFSTVAIAQNNNVCERATYVDNEFEQVVDIGEYWYVATTYDLPLTLYYIPEDNEVQLPDVFLDLTCTPGVYDDPKIAQLVKQAKENFEVTFPISESWEINDLDGDKAYAITFDKTCRNILYKAGVAYEVPAYMHFKTFGRGTITIRSTSIHNECRRRSIPLEFGQQMPIAITDTDNVYIWSVGDWVDKNYAIYWDGEQPLDFYIGKDCYVDPDRAFTQYRKYTLDDTTRINMNKTEAMEIVTDIMLTEAYIKMVPTSTGILHVEEVDTGAYIRSFFVGGVYALIDEENKIISATLPAGTTKLTAMQNAVVDYYSFKKVELIYNRTYTELYLGDITYKLQISVAKDQKDHDNSLKTLLIDGQPLDGFTGSTLTYLDVPTYNSSPKISCTTNSTKATFTVQDAVSVPGTAKITVTSEAGEVAYYTIYFVKGKSRNASLRSITVDGLPLAGFAPDKFEYKKDILWVPIVTAIPADQEAKVYVRQLVKIPGSAQVVVTAAAGNVQIYTINFSLDARVGACADNTRELTIGTTLQINNSSDDVIRINGNKLKTNKTPARFLWSGNESASIYIGSTCQFDPLTAEQELLATYNLTEWKGKGLYRYQLTTYDLVQLSNRTLDGNLYVRIVGKDNANLTLEEYEPDCETRAELFDLQTQYDISANAFTQIHALYLPDWQKKDIEVRWDGPSTLEFFIADTCDFLLQSTNTHLLAEGYHQLAPSQSFIITQGVAKGWAERVGDFAYARLLNGAQGTLTLTIIKDYNDDTPIVKQQYQLTLTAEPRDAGIFSINDGMTEQSYTNDILIDENTNIKITAIADEHYSFRSWSDGNAQNPRSVNMNTNKQYTALFAANKYTITVSPSDAAMGRVSGSGRYSYLASVNIEARANRGYRFEYWLTDGGEQGTLIDNPMSIIVEGDRKYEAVFVDENTATDNVRTDTDQPHKIIRNNEILILMPDGRTLNLLGQETK